MPRKSTLPKLLALTCLALASHASAHFVFIVPQPDATQAQIILSENLKPDDEVTVEKIAPARFTLRDAAGKSQPLTTTADKHALTAAVPADAAPGARTIFGTVEFGVKQRGESKPYLLLYHPKAIVGSALDPTATLGQLVPAELVPTGKHGGIQLQFLARGKPVPDAEVNLVLPDGKETKVKTDAQGLTPPLQQIGQHGAWARFFEPATGEKEGKKYDELRHYPTLVFTNPAPK